MCVPAGSMIADMWRLPETGQCRRRRSLPLVRYLKLSRCSTRKRPPGVCVWLSLSFSICCWRHVIHRGTRGESEREHGAACVPGGGWGRGRRGEGGGLHEPLRMRIIVEIGDEGRISQGPTGVLAGEALSKGRGSLLLFARPAPARPRPTTRL